MGNVKDAHTTPVLVPHWHHQTARQPRVFARSATRTISAIK